MSSYRVVFTSSDPDSLQHFGIKGQKWGVRRYQNDDGSLTQLGKEHYAISSGGNGALAKKYSQEEKKLKRYKKNQDIDLQTKNAISYNKKSRIAGRVSKAATAVAIPMLGLATATKEGTPKKVTDFLYDVNYHTNAMANDPTGKLMVTNNNKLFDNTKTRGRHNLLNSFTKDEEKKIADATSKFLIKNYNHPYLNNDTAWAKNVNAVSKAVGAAAAATAVGAKTAQAVYYVKARVAEKRISDIGHAKALAKYNAQYNKMLKMFEGTAYEDILKKQQSKSD